MKRLLIILTVFGLLTGGLGYSEAIAQKPEKSKKVKSDGTVKEKKVKEDGTVKKKTTKPDGTVKKEEKKYD
ncbi:MAG: hypothetical protein K2X86_18735 [Cytophagaceae bacterium]|nr:hypothetical protein [Cytophagaceae bacterium]